MNLTGEIRTIPVFLWILTDCLHFPDIVVDWSCDGVILAVIGYRWRSNTREVVVQLHDVYAECLHRVVLTQFDVSVGNVSNLQ